MAKRLSSDLLETFGDDRIVGTFDAAAFCNFSVSHFRSLYRSGLVPAPIKISGRKLGWKVSTLKAHVDQVARKAPS
jgi:predicted DNA-binding transcriptional regulator AlpA